MARGPATFGTILSAAVAITNAVLFVVCRAYSGCWDWLEPVPTGHRGACVESGRTKKGPECNVVLGGGSGMQRVIHGENIQSKEIKAAGNQKSLKQAQVLLR